MHAFGCRRHFELPGPRGGLASLCQQAVHRVIVVFRSVMKQHQPPGTDFFRHKRTMTDRVPMDSESLKRIGYSSYEELQHDILDKDSFDRSKWEHTMTVPMRFNRLVLLQPHYWHTSGPAFGDNVENGRLIYLMFFLRGQAAQAAA